MEMSLKKRHIYHEVKFTSLEELNAFLDCYDEEEMRGDDFTKIKCFFCAKRLQLWIDVWNGSKDRFKVFLRKYIGITVEIYKDCEHLYSRQLTEEPKQ